MTIAGYNYKRVVEYMLRFPDCTFLITDESLPTTISCIRDEELLRSTYRAWLADVEAGCVRQPLDYISPDFIPVLHGSLNPDDYEDRASEYYNPNNGSSLYVANVGDF